MAYDLEQTRRDLMLQAIERNSEYSESILKWCNTTICALNGGALVTLFTNFEKLDSVVPSAAWYFGAGVFSSILASFMFSLSYSQMAAGLADQVWKNESLDADSYSDVVVKGLGMWLTGITMLFMVASAALLILGSFEVMESISQAKSS